MKRLLDRELFWLASASIGMLISWFGPWRFQTNDDIIMMWLVSGAYTGEPEGYAVFMHPSLSWVLSELYKFSLGFNWYAFLWYTIIWLSNYSLVKWSAFIDVDSALRRIVLGIALILSLHFCLFLQFTIVAGWAGFIGALCLFRLSKRESFSLDLLGFTLIFLGFLVRWEAVLVELFLLMVFYWASMNLSLKNWLFRAIGITLLFLGVFASKTIYEESGQYAEYVAFNKARSSVLDHPVYYHISREEKLPVDSEWRFFSAWMIDSLELDIADLNEARLELNQQRWELKYFWKSIERLITVLKTELFKSAFGIILIVLFFLSSLSPKVKTYFGLIWLLFFLAMNYWFVLQGRVIILFLIPFIGILLLSNRSVKILSWPTYILSFCWVLLSLHIINAYRGQVIREEIQDEYLSLVKDVHGLNPIFIENLYEFNLPMNFDSDNLVPTLSYGWISKSPFQKKAYELRGFRNLKNLQQFSLLNFKNQETPIFPLYMKKLQEESFELIDYQETGNFDFFTFRRASMSF